MTGRAARQLRFATDGCCDGHLCDDCGTCRTGRCCRSDNPHYRLPAEGDWDGPIYGTIGMLDRSGDTLECHACGRDFKHLGPHVWMIHNLTADEYRAIFGLSSSTPICNKAIAARVSEVAKESVASGKINLPAEFAGSFARATPEQRADWHERGTRNMRTEGRRVRADIARRTALSDTGVVGKRGLAKSSEHRAKIAEGVRLARQNKKRGPE